MGLIISSLTLSMNLALSPVCKLNLKPTLEDYKYYKHGDIIIGGIFTVYYHMDEFPSVTYEKIMRCAGLVTVNYKYFLNFLFAIEEVNRNPYILPNVTLGYHVYDSCSKANKAVKSTIQILSGPGATVPNYYCTGEDNIAGFIGDLLSVTTVPIAQLLNMYGYTQNLKQKRMPESSEEPRGAVEEQCDRCLPTSYKNTGYRPSVNFELPYCSGKENVTELPVLLKPDGSPVAYNALMSMTYALHALHIFLGREVFSNYLKKSTYRHKLNKYLKELEYMDQSGMIKYYDKRGEFNIIFHIYNWKLIENKYANYIFVGSFTPWAPPDKQLLINSSRIFWKNNKIPRSQCSEYCPPGSRKLKNDKKPICCYDCVKCPDGEISNTTDSENCIKCLDTEWSSSKRNQCFPKLEEFLSFSDGLSIALSSIAILFWTISILILGIFVSHKDSAIVKANNKTLSFILLISLSLCFLCVFLFIGRPVDRTCKLRQIVFGIIFSISVSSVLAKTIMVYMAFRISRPGNRWKKIIGIKVSNSIVVVASSIEVIISIIWLYLSPPYLEQDTHSYHRKVIIQCNEGSQVGFFAVLGYLFVLAAVSFTVAYLARTLPDRFNEAKYITFSMLVFCSVWITMVPSYLSTKGKNMVAVEIFSILTSSAGLLGFIFFPKCYIILINPQLNIKMRIHMEQ
ncbi:vomeronasal type-2 receptor 26-like [Dendropsophus ebraccatus]|uniref:vomeronasal type-2 receptor 26-like n=1 Tax=Dendropsophus ebraccatus TaxID=150705 RepID=UPI0038320F1C